jgi:hypothetical protein
MESTTDGAEAARYFHRMREAEQRGDVLAAQLQETKAHLAISNAENISLKAHNERLRRDRRKFAALEAVIAELKRLDEWSSSPDWPGWNAVESVWAITRKAPSTVLDQMVREAKAEAWEKGFSAGEEDVLEHGRTSWAESCTRTNPYGNGDA